MTMSRIQFQAGLSLPRFIERYGTEEKARPPWKHARLHVGCFWAQLDPFYRHRLHIFIAFQEV